MIPKSLCDFSAYWYQNMPSEITDIKNMPFKFPVFQEKTIASLLPGSLVRNLCHPLLFHLFSVSYQSPGTINSLSKLSFESGHSCCSYNALSFSPHLFFFFSNCASSAISSEIPASKIELESDYSSTFTPTWSGLDTILSDLKPELPLPASRIFLLKKKSGLSPSQL